MSTQICEFLGGFLQRGPCFIGQVRISPKYCLCHVENAETHGLQVFSDPHDAIEIARFDDAGKYRPLKTAPNLRHGWFLHLKSASEVVLALDFLYPAALGTALAFSQNKLTHVDLRETLGRQTGMYAVTRKLSDEQAQGAVTRICNPRKGCLRVILWSISPDHPTSLTMPGAQIQCSGNEIPILCAEACNLFIAATRRIVKPPTT
ncbi:MAG TPA: DR2241 family protein [Terrimicrobiaceae bacterium]